MGRISIKKSGAGFTLIEIIIAITVMTIGIVGSYAVVPAMVRNQAVNLDEFTASQLAHEAMEIVRNFRDTNWLNDLDWKAGLLACSSGCEIDYNDPGFSSFQDRFLQIDSNGLFNYGLGASSKFKRKIIIQEQGDALNVKIQVLWNGKGSPFEAEENFYDWR
ncbi:MAG: type II secretion system protein [Candidatus Pacebacteria bacterium]|nr:type II secretion system protein [Candidatus Paceibacterota bacterium]